MFRFEAVPCLSPGENDASRRLRGALPYDGVSDLLPADGGRRWWPLKITEPGEGTGPRFRVAGVGQKG
ncbi:MAG: hypothetical protein D6725_16395 [Planctomycetota bacterium]|nr:MAG: hypothetical protein D6725_16395 [Planctomycetota bacterium]